MKKSIIFSLVCLIVAGCASTDRMTRMSGGVFDEYSAPKSSRIRSEKYQKLSREFSSASRSNKVEVAGIDDTLINIWPFFFRSNAYWSALWPLIDSDPYGFAFRPFYNHEGDDYSVIFPLSAWNNVEKSGWVTLFAWTPSGFGLIPLTWQWQEGFKGGAYYTPLFMYAYDKTPFEYKGYQGTPFYREDHFLSAFGVINGRETRVDLGEWDWLFWDDYEDKNFKNEWIYRFNGSKPYPENYKKLDEFRREIYNKSPRVETRSYGFVPLWLGEFSDNGDYENRFMLFAGNAKRNRDYHFDVAGDLLGKYREIYNDDYTQNAVEKEFTSFALLSQFSVRDRYNNTALYRALGKLHRIGYSYDGFNRAKPEIIDTLKEIDPQLTLPATVVDDRTYNIYVDELTKKYLGSVPTSKVYEGLFLPLFHYRIAPESSSWVLPTLLTWWENEPARSKFTSWPLMTFIRRSPEEESTTVMTPLVYYAKEFHRKRADYPVFSNDCQRVREFQCAELRDRYVACGLFYRGRFGFNVVKSTADHVAVEELRSALSNLHYEYEQLKQRDKNIIGETGKNDRWVTATEIERLKKLIRYEELKIERTKLTADEAKFNTKIGKALANAEKIGFKLDRETLENKEKADAARSELVEKYTELRFYEDIGNGLFFRKEKNSNGDYNWHFCHILAGGEKNGDRESTNILHLLYRYRKEGSRSEKIFFPFVSVVEDGEDSRVSFLWRVFSLSKRNGKTGGYIFFIPFGDE